MTTKHVLRICRAEWCLAKGSDALIEHVEKSLGIKLGQATTDGMFSLDTVYCIGNCSNSPNFLLDGKPCGRMTAELADFILEELRD